MKFFFRYAGVLLMLLIIAIPASLQDESTDDSTSDSAIRVGGSGIAAQVFNALAESTGTSDAFEVTPSGTDSGLAQLCGGSVDIGLSTRVLTEAEGNNCETLENGYYEILLAYDTYAYAVQEGFEELDCVTSTEETLIFAPSSVSTVTTWADVNEEASDLALSVYLPAPNTTAYNLLDILLPGAGFRSDAQLFGSYEEVLSAVAETEGAIGLVTLAAAEGVEGVTLLPLRSRLTGSCAEPSQQNISDGIYDGATGLFAYINANVIDNEAVDSLLGGLSTEEGAQAIADAGFTPMAEQDLNTVVDALANNETGRIFSKAVVAYQIPPSVTGTAAAGGSPAAFQYVNTLTQNASQQYANLVVETNFAGQSADADLFCTGVLDMLFVSDALTDEQRATCEENEIEFIEQDLGDQVVALVANASSDYLACMTTEQIRDTFIARPEDALPMMWNSVSEDYPEAETFLFAPRSGNVATAVLLTSVSDGPVIERPVTENNPDVLYRAAATANVEGALTYMTWNEYQRVLESGQEGIQLVSVDSGNGCVEPSLETVNDGSYALTRGVTVLVNRASFANEAVKAFAWYMFSNQNYPRLESAGFVGLTVSDFVDVRETLQDTFDVVDAEVAAAEALQLEAETTEEPTGDGDATEGTEDSETETEDSEGGEG